MVGRENQSLVTDTHAYWDTGHAEQTLCCFLILQLSKGEQTRRQMELDWPVKSFQFEFEIEHTWGTILNFQALVDLLCSEPPAAEHGYQFISWIILASEC